MTVTIKDIAKVSGVSHSIVSCTLLERPAIPLGTIIRIKQHAENLDDDPSTVAST